MNPLVSYAVKSLRKNKAGTAMTIIGVMMSAALITALAAFGTSLYHYLQEGYTDKYGDWHVGIANGKQEDIESICMEEGIREPVLAESIGYASVKTGRHDKPYLYLQGVGAEYYEHMPVHLTEGRIPEREGELLLPESFRKAVEGNLETGDMVELEVGLRIRDGAALWQHVPYGADAEGVSNGEDTKEKLQHLQTGIYQIAGFYDTSDSTGSAPGYEALAWWDGKAQEDDYGRLSLWFQIADTGNAEFHKVYDELRLMYGYSNVQIPINTELLSIYGIRMTDAGESVAVAVAACILLFIILAGSVMLIYNAFAISVSERTRQFGLLSSVGATKKQIRGCVLCEAAIVSVSGVFVGIFLGIGIVAAVLEAAGGMAAELLDFSIGPHLYVWFPSVILAVVLAVITVLVSAWIPAVRATKVTAIEAIRQNRELRYYGKKKRVPAVFERLFGYEGVLAVTYARRNRKRYRVTTAALFLSMVLFISINAFSGYMMTVMQTEYKTSNYDILIQFPSEIELPEKEWQAVLERLRRLDGVDQVTRVTFLSYRMPPEENKSHVTDDFQEILEEAAHGKMTVTFSVVDDESFSGFCRGHGLDESHFLDIEDPTVIVKNRFQTADQKSGNTKIVEGLLEKDGRFYVQLASGAVGMDGADGQDRMAEFAAGYYTESLAPGCNDSWNLCIMLPECVAKNMGLQNNMEDLPQSYFMTAKDHRKAMDDAMKLFEAEGIEGTAYDQAERQTGSRNLVLLLRVLANGFMIMISVLSIANVFNTISTNLKLRQKEFAMLKTVGMTPEGLRRMMNLECLMYGGKAALYGFPVSVLAAAVMYHFFRREVVFDFYLPAASVLIAVGSIFAVVFITMLYTMRCMKKENVIDVLRQESF